MSSHAAQKGFSLVELSIVLVIIGLIVGGVLTGQDLIRTAEVKATISQLERFNAAVNTFKAKYGGQLPGDISKAVAYGLGTKGGLGDDGNGNGLLSDATRNSNSITLSSGEIVNFWYHLSRSKLLDGNYDGKSENSLVGQTFPATKLGRGGFTVYNVDGSNYYHIGVADSLGVTHTLANSLRPEEAFNIDTKIDDGYPLSGAATAIKGNATSNMTVADSGSVGSVNCINSDPDEIDEYNISNTQVLCQLRIRMN